MTSVIQVVDVTQIRQNEGVFLPKELFAGCKGIAVELTDDGTIILRPKKHARIDIYRSMDARRESLREKYGFMEDSSHLIRQDRDSR